MMQRGTRAPAGPAGGRPHPGGFTLIELLVVVGIIALLISILAPALNGARQAANIASCLANLRQVGIGIQAYAHDYRGAMPYGPKAPPVMTATEFYPSTGAPTSLISLSSGKAVGLGLLLQHHLASQARVLFCPGADQTTDALAELEKVGRQQAQCSYFYRHDSVPLLFDPAGPARSAERIRLAGLGVNRNGRPIRALAMDTQLRASGGYAAFGVRSRTHHGGRSSSILYSDGHAVSVANEGNWQLVDLDDPAIMSNPFERILSVLERADTEP